MPSFSSTSLNFPQYRTKHIKPRAPKLPCIVQSLLNISSREQLSQAVASLELLSKKGIRLPSSILANLLQHCGNFSSLREGKWVHLHLKLTGFKRPTTYLANHLIIMYFKCGDEVGARKVFDKMAVRNLYSWNNMLSGYSKLGKVKPARKLFDKMPEKDIISWNTMIIAYVQNGLCYEAFQLYKKLRSLSIGYNEFTFSAVLTVCIKLNELGLSRQVHGQVFITGNLLNVVLTSSIVNVYGKCGEMADARRLFDDMPLKDVHAWTTLVSGYARWGDMESAAELFSQMPEKNSISWTALISGYARNNMGYETLDFFRKMMLGRVRPDQYTFSSCLCACASIASLRHGKQIHAYLIRKNIKPNVIVVSSIIDMYSKCGYLDYAKRVFNLVEYKQDLVLWNTIISALGQHGLGVEALDALNDMLRSGLKPGRITFIVILRACSHSGLLQEGLHLFKSMTDLGVFPDQEHYACLIDLLGRAGCFDELLKHLQVMHCEHGDQFWNALLGVCRIHRNIELGREAAERLLQLDPQSSAAYILLSSIYAACRKWELVEDLRQRMEHRSVRKERAMSWIEVENKICAFTVSDQSHPLKEILYSLLGHLVCHMEDNFSLISSGM